MEKRNGANYKVKLMCSYGGMIQPRPHDHQLTYFGGDTKILTVDRRIKFSDIVPKLTSLFNAADHVSLKYQLPGEDLDALVSVINGDDLDHMMDEYDRIHRTISSKPARIRLFLFPPNPPPKSAPLNPDFLFGFDDEYDYGTTQTDSTPKPEISRVVDTVEQFISGSGTCNGALIEGITGHTFSRDSHVAVGAHAGGEVVYYGIPVATGGYGYGYEYEAVVPAILNREQPVYNFAPMMPSALEQKLGYNSSHPTLMMASTFF